MASPISTITRYELKYTINESQAHAIRDYIGGFFSLDRHADPATKGYTVNNLYFETPDRRFYHDVKFRKLRRVKPRVRYYGFRPENSLWLELKYRHDSIIWKFRRPIPLEDWPSILEQPEERFADVGREHVSTSFEHVVTMTDARPMVHVRYFREPYVSDLDVYGRVTFDRRLVCHATNGSTDMVPDAAMISCDDPVTARDEESPVILEIKTESAVPFWATQIIREFNLKQRGFSKYCYAVERLAESPENRVSRLKGFR